MERCTVFGTFYCLPLDGVSNAQGWENATEDLWNSFDQQNDQRLDVTLKRSFTYSDGSIKDFDKPYVLSIGIVKPNLKGIIQRLYSGNSYSRDVFDYSRSFE